MDNEIVRMLIASGIFITSFIVGFLIGMSYKKPCQKCKADDLETQELLKEQQNLSKGF